MLLATIGRIVSALYHGPISLAHLAASFSARINFLLSVKPAGINTTIPA